LINALFKNYRVAAASIRFEIWGGRESGARNLRFKQKKFLTLFFSPQLKKV